MDGTRFRAGIELTGRVMRYAEVDLGARGADASPRLTRLGACDFDFDVGEAILNVSGPTHLDTVATAIREIFDGSEADRLFVAVHPWDATAFFSPVSAEAPPVARLEQFRQEAAMLADVTVARPVRVNATPVRIAPMPDGSRYHWHHVLHLSQSIHARLAHLAKPFARRDGGYEFVAATGSAAAITARLAPVPDDGEPSFALAVGVYGNRTEFALSQGETWYYGHYVEADAGTDGAYFAGAMLDRLGLAASQIRRLFVYGDAAEPAPAAGLSAWLGVEAEPLNPLRVFGLAPPDANPFALAAYTPCVGALLR